MTHSIGFAMHVDADRSADCDRPKEREVVSRPDEGGGRRDATGVQDPLMLRGLGLSR
jgi:hypothetical protein